MTVLYVKPLVIINSNSDANEGLLKESYTSGGYLAFRVVMCKHILTQNESMCSSNNAKTSNFQYLNKNGLVNRWEKHGRDVA